MSAKKTQRIGEMDGRYDSFESNESRRDHGRA